MAKAQTALGWISEGKSAETRSAVEIRASAEKQAEDG